MTANQEVALLNNKIRVHELAKQLKSSSKRILEMLDEIGIKNKSYMSVLEDEELRKFYELTGFKSNKDNENAVDDSAAKKIAAQKEQQTQGKASGVIVRRIIVESSSDSSASELQKNSVNKKGQKQSREAGSGLRSGYMVRTAPGDDLYESDKNEKKEVAEKNTISDVPVKTEPTVRRVKRVKKEDAEQIRQEEHVKAAEEIKVPSEEIPAKEEKVEEKTVTAEKFVFKQYEYSEVITIEVENDEPSEPIEIFTPSEQKTEQRPQRQP